VLIALERAMQMIKKKKLVEVNKKKGVPKARDKSVPKARDKRLVQMQARICDSSLTLQQRRMILLEVGKWRG
jgi:hypothetical protein